jgi:acetyl-CoA carboxylase carboxyl transferase subunit alpha
VISPEGCAAILWKEANERTNALAARSLNLTSKDNLELGIIDEIIPEPAGGAHRFPKQTASNLQQWIVGTLAELKREPMEALLRQRYERYRKMGQYLEAAPEVTGSAAT